MNFNTPLGQYFSQCMPFGVVMSQGIFQAKKIQILEGSLGTLGIADDIVIFGLMSMSMILASVTL